MLRYRYASKKSLESYTIKVKAESRNNYELSGNDLNGLVKGTDPKLTFLVGSKIDFLVPQNAFFVPKNAFVDPNSSHCWTPKMHFWAPKCEKRSKMGFWGPETRFGLQNAPWRKGGKVSTPLLRPL